MNEKQMILIGVLVAAFIAFIVIVELIDNKSLNGIKSKRIGDGQHGTARWATKSEVKRTFISLLFEPDKWRRGENIPHSSNGDVIQGTVVGCIGAGKKTVALVDTGEVHTLMIGAAGVGKTAYFLYPNIELACASGMSFISTDTKGDVARNYGTIAKKYYGVPKNKPCKRNNRQISDNTKIAAKQGNAEERPDAGCGIKRWKAAAEMSSFFNISPDISKADKPQEFEGGTLISRQAANLSSKYIAN